MKNRTFNLTPIASGIAVALGVVPLSALAQTPAADSDEDLSMEVVVVQGVRRSLEQSSLIKRDSAGVVDAITAEDIGKFPDTNLAEAMSRISGVSIDRKAGEGSKITVRGIGPDYNLVLLNGRQMPASSLLDTRASISRAYDFANLASETVAAVDVYKTSMANIPTGGIGATINIRTARPLDMEEQVANVGAKLVTDQSAPDNSWTPEFSGIFAKTFAEGTFGVAVSGVYQDRDFGFNQAATTSGWRSFKGDENNWGTIPQEGSPGSENITNRPGPNDTYSVPQNINYSINEGNRKRTNGQLVLQWRPIDSITATLDYTYSELKVSNKRNELSAWFNFGPSISTWTDGPVAAPLSYTETYLNPQGQPIYPTDIGAGGAQYAVKTTNGSLGFNLEWAATDTLNFALDYANSYGESGKDSPYGTNSILGGVGFYRGTTTVDFSEDFPVLSMATPNNSGLDASQMLTGGASYRNSYTKSEVDQLDLSGDFAINDTMSLDFGYTNTKVKNRSAFSNVQYDDWGGKGSPADYPDDVWHIRDVSSAFDNIPGSDNPALFDQMFTWDFATVAGLRQAATGQSQAASDDFTTDRRTTEKSNAGYLQYVSAFDIGQMPSHFRAGIRYEDTKVNSSALVPIAEKLLWAGTNEFNIVYGAPGFTELDGKYNYWLPNFDFNIEPVENVIFRTSYSKTIGRPGWGDIQGGQTLNGLVRIDGGTGQQGNPGLLPLESKNIDLSLEWYFTEGSYASVGYFHKKVANYVGITQIESTPFNLPHPGQGLWYDQAVAATGSTDPQQIRQWIFDNYGDNPAVTITGVGTNGFTTGTIAGIEGQDPPSTFAIQVPSNQETATIDGWEFAYQQLFGESGFGAIANYTIVDSNKNYDNLALNNQFAIEGLSDSANLVGFYDDHGWVARLAYNWRDQFLAARFDGNNNQNPLYTKSYGQLDGLVSYTWENGLTLFVEGFNLTDEYETVVGRNPYAVNYVTQTGRRYGIGARYSF